jgi:UDP-N-acetylmuramate--alanine ligase
MLEGIQRVHFIGIGGAGMSGIAKVLCELGFTVSGSDLQASEATRRLQDHGAHIFIGHNRGQIGDAQLVVVSTAIPPSNAELLEAQEKGMEIWQRARMLGAIMSRQKGIAIAGAHGKTTTTSMISMIMERSGLDPSVVVGGELNDIGGNAKLGKGDYLVAEADESDGSFLNLDPHILVVTNIENDHLDYYGSLENILATFRAMMKKVPQDGLAVVCADDGNIHKVQDSLTCNVLTYGIDASADFQPENIRWLPLGSKYDLHFRGENLGTVHLSVPGLHNIKNSLAAMAVCLQVGVDFHAAAAALEKFHGVHRRFQLMGEVGGIRVFDDYAHHPSEVKATLDAARQQHPGRVVAVFQPHRFTRTKFLQHEFGTAFSVADWVILTDIYSAGEQPIEGIHTQLLEKHIADAGHSHVQYVEQMNDIAGIIAGELQPGDIVLTMGAGSIWQVGPALLQKLNEIAEKCTN